MAISRKWRRLMQYVCVLFCLSVLYCLYDENMEGVRGKLIRERGTPMERRIIRACVDKSPETLVRKKKKVQKKKDYQKKSCSKRLLLNTFRYRRVRESVQRLPRAG
ncbi:hypothetical protein H1C71_038320, partial [Ictidomys tridecemlineatus]